jgi:glycosyltransferase involved in cell wall biosynthesis
VTNPMIAAAFAIPGDINLPTGGYTYDRRLLALLPRHGIAVQHVELPGSFPDPDPADLTETERRLASVAAGAVLLIDGLAYGAMPAQLIRRVPAPIVALVHHPLCLEAGLLDARQSQLYGLEKAALALARRIITTSKTTARTLVADFAVPEQSITVAEPGTDVAARAHGTHGPVQLLAVGAVVPRKAYDILVRALGTLKDHEWRLTIAGPTDRSAEGLASLQATIRATGLSDRITLAGPVGPEHLDSLYASADVFLMPSLYEGYGMALAEAMARGLPTVCTTGGAAAETAPDAAAIKVAPGDEGALAVAIGGLLADPALRRRMSDASWAAGQALPCWEDTARTIARVLQEVAP